MACYKSEALSDAKRAVCLNPEWEKVSIKHGCLSTNLSPIIIYTCSSFSFASWRRNAALVIWIFLSSFLSRNWYNFMQCIPYFFLTKETSMDASWLSWILMIIASFYFVLIIITISGSLQICTGIFWTWIYWKGHGCKLTCSEVLFIHT